MIRALSAALAVVMALLVIQSVRVDRLKTETRKQAEQIKAWADYKAAADEDALIAADQCAARVAEAAALAGRVSTLLNREVPRDPQGCPYRVMLSADELRRTLQPGAQAPADASGDDLR